MFGIFQREQVCFVSSEDQLVEQRRLINGCVNVEESEPNSGLDLAEDEEFIKIGTTEDVEMNGEDENQEDEDDFIPLSFQLLCVVIYVSICKACCFVMNYGQWIVRIVVIYLKKLEKIIVFDVPISSLEQICLLQTVY